MKQRLITILELKKQQLQRGLQQVREQAGRTADWIKSKFARIGNIKIGGDMLGGFGKFLGITAIVGAITTALVKTTKWAADLEQVNVAFETMLGSAENAKKMVDDLTKFSVVTPFEPTEVYNSGRALLSYGDAAKNIIPDLRMIGDVASGSMQPLGDMVNIFGKAMNKGKLQAEELNQLSERGIPIIQALADKYNVTTDAIYKMASEGKISFNDLRDAFRAMTSEGGIYFNSMGKQSETLGGLFSTILGDVKNIGASIAEKWVPALKDAARESHKIAQELQQGRQDQEKSEVREMWLPTPLDDVTDVMADADFGGLEQGGFLQNTIKNTIGLPFRGLRALGLAGSQPGLKLQADADPIAKERLAQKQKDRAEGKNTPTWPEQQEAEKRAAEQKAEADKAARIANTIEQQVISKIDDGAATDKRQAFIDKFIQAAEKIAQGAGAKLSPEQRQNITDKAGTVYDQKEESGAKGKFSDAMETLKSRLEYQRLIVAGKKREAEISKEIAQIEQRMGRKMTPEERDALTTAAGEKYDLESKLDKSTITSRRGNLSDRLLQIGGMIGNAPALQNVDRERNSLLKQIVDNTADIKIEGGIEIA